MHIELRHLRTVQAIHEEGGLARAADRLHITQSALSHQIKGLEAQAGIELFVRRSKPMRLSAAGLKLLRLAEEVLPRITALEEEFEGLPGFAEAASLPDMKTEDDYRHNVDTRKIRLQESR